MLAAGATAAREAKLDLAERDMQLGGNGQCVPVLHRQLLPPRLLDGVCLTRQVSQFGRPGARGEADDRGLGRVRIAVGTAGERICRPAKSPR